MSPSARKTPPWLLALGREAPPNEIQLAGRTYRRDKIFKHDFFAFTGRYVGPTEGDTVVLKIGRKASFFGFPLSWIGRLHAWHESRVMRAVEDLEVVPQFTGRHGRHGLTHRYVEGHQLERGERVPDDFFDRLRAGLAEIHTRNIAYVDLEKPENVLVGDDGKPYLFDFQISYRYPFKRGGGFPLFRWLRRSLQQSDIYHLNKLQRRTRPDLMSDEEIAASRRRPDHLRFYGSVTRPFTHVRRMLLNRLDPVKKRGERGRVQQHASRAE